MNDTHNPDAVAQQPAADETKLATQLHEIAQQHNSEYDADTSFSADTPEPAAPVKSKTARKVARKAPAAKARKTKSKRQTFKPRSAKQRTARKDARRK